MGLAKIEWSVAYDFEGGRWQTVSDLIRGESISQKSANGWGVSRTRDKLGLMLRLELGSAEAGLMLGFERGLKLWRKWACHWSRGLYILDLRIVAPCRPAVCSKQYIFLPSCDLSTSRYGQSVHSCSTNQLVEEMYLSAVSWNISSVVRYFFLLIFHKYQDDDFRQCTSIGSIFIMYWLETGKIVSVECYPE